MTYAKPLRACIQIASIFMVGLLAISGLFAGSGAKAEQQSRQALLMSGKQTLFRRIVTKPGGQLLAKPGRTARVVADKVPPFSVFYVYGEENGFTEVGVNNRGGAKGWIETDKVVD